VRVGKARIKVPWFFRSLALALAPKLFSLFLLLSRNLFFLGQKVMRREEDVEGRGYLLNIIFSGEKKLLHRIGAKKESPNNIS
jgi:hypothetical protein